MKLKLKIKSASAPNSPSPPPKAPPPSPANHDTYLHFDGHGDVEFYSEGISVTPLPDKVGDHKDATGSGPGSPDGKSELAKDMAQQQQDASQGGPGFSLWGLETFLTVVDRNP